MGRETSCRLVRFQSTMQILVDLTEEVAESIMDRPADPLAWTARILICKDSGTDGIRLTDSIFNESYIMAKLKVTEIGRNWWNRRSRRDIYVNGKHSGVLTGDDVEIEVEPGPCEVTVQNVFPSFRSTAYINIEEKAEHNPHVCIYVAYLSDNLRHRDQPSQEHQSHINGHQEVQEPFRIPEINVI